MDIITQKRRKLLERKLPKYVIFQSHDNNRYLHFDREYPKLPNALRFEGEYSFGLETRFEVVPATTGNGLVHIRSLQNNKYWENSGVPDNWVTATADKPDENQSDKHCTLFKPEMVMLHIESCFVKLRHVNTGNYVRRYNGIANSDDYLGCLTLKPKLQSDDRTADVCTFIDWESVVMLPDLVRIKGNNENHLKAHADGSMDFNHKADNSSSFDYEVSPSRDGGIRLQSTAHLGTYWNYMADSSQVLLKHVSTTVHDPNTVFLPTILGDNSIIMKCLENGKYCNRHENCLATLNKFPDDWSTMEIEEPVISRKIDNVRYHLTDGRRYDEKTVALITDDSINRTRHPLTSEINLKTTVSDTTNWSNSVGLKVGASFTVSTEVSGSWDWGETQTKSQEVGSVRTIIVPPMTRLKASLMATRCSCDVPYSYTQRDVLKNGRTIVSEKNDGLFTAHNGYGYQYEVVELPLE
ncbi:hypothetical protein MKX03_006981 [Papaver bracteatum]|nr:hypothetical protein MKX03_006981 [Papaver bracteatum]